MSGRFVRAAFRVLDQEQKPLTPEQIVRIATDQGFLNSSGKTPVHTMRARLSDEIRRAGAGSEFLRTGSNRFGLRSWGFTEHHARPFTRELPDETTVCVPGTIESPMELNGVGFSSDIERVLAVCRDRPRLSFIPRRTAEMTTRYRQLIAYAWLETSDGFVLSYTRGKYSSAHRTLLLGKRSVGFGGHVLAEDADGLFGADDGGLEQAGLREIGEELGHAAPRELRPAGVIWDDTSSEGQKHIGVVMVGRLEHSSRVPVRSNELSINELRLLSREELWGHFHTMEFWSQLLIRQFADASRPTNISTVVPKRRPRDVKHIALVGEIANGKSQLGEGLVRKLGYRIVSASGSLRRLLGVGEFAESSRLEFQSQALRFINTADGPSRLAQEIAAEARHAGDGPVVIDGIRQLTTLGALRELLPNIVVVYVDCPRDLAFQNYRSRLEGVSALQFAAVREHAVESDLPLFRFESDAIICNADSFERSMDAFIRWLTSE